MRAVGKARWGMPPARLVVAGAHGGGAGHGWVHGADAGTQAPSVLRPGPALLARPRQGPC